MRSVEPGETFETWRAVARGLLAEGVAPTDVLWTCDDQPALLLGGSPTRSPQGAGLAAPTHAVPRRFLQLAKRVACHRDAERWSLLYRVLWRLTRTTPRLLEQTADPDVVRLRALDAHVRRDVHKMHAFVRFRRVGDDHYVAWYRPMHRVIPLTAPWFAARFAIMRWTIMTPDATATWDTKRLHFGPGVPREHAPPPDELEALWCTYYASTFNPARVNIPAMLNEMPKQYWATMPETALLDDLLLKAPEKLSAMAQRVTQTAQHLVPDDAALPVLQAAARGCDACPLHGPATQTVFGEGPPDARIALVGEQPGDSEDRAGRPFMGPAGQLLDRALEAAGLDREALYLTNAVKHFRFREDGPKRLHARPKPKHVVACLPWLQAELRQVRPDVIVALGATAARALLGRAIRVEDARGRLQRSPLAKHGVWVTGHPAAVLRASGDRAAHLYGQLVDDLAACRAGQAAASSV